MIPSERDVPDPGNRGKGTDGQKVTQITIPESFVSLSQHENCESVEGEEYGSKVHGTRDIPSQGGKEIEDEAAGTPALDKWNKEGSFGHPNIEVINDRTKEIKNG